MSDENAANELPKDPRDFVLVRELSEVHLLLDHLSASPTKALPDDAPNGDGETAWLRDICEVKWPPEKSDEGKADDAALLIRSKDRLNRLAHPASGSSIAFTLLVVQEDNEPARARGPQGSPSRASMARLAYPGFVRKAQVFRQTIFWMSLILLGLLVLTCMLSWHTAASTSLVAQLTSAQSAYAAVQKRIDEVEASDPSTGARPTATTGEDSQAAAGTAALPPEVPARLHVSLCERQMLLPRLAPEGAPPIAQYPSATAYQLCTERERLAAEVEARAGELSSWMAWAPHPQGASPAFYASAVNVLGGAVLPVLYGFLGAAAAVVRSLSSKIRNSLLSPRDLHLSLQQLALGAVVGACIGLFITPTADQSTGATLLPQIALSVSAVSFIAGFGVEAVFKALEGLIARIFDVPPTSEAPARA